jgi:hypothetical protein
MAFDPTSLTGATWAAAALAGIAFVWAVLARGWRREDEAAKRRAVLMREVCDAQDELQAALAGGDASRIALAAKRLRDAEAALAAAGGAR